MPDGVPEISVSGLEIDGIQVHVYLGPKPRFGVSDVVASSRYVDHRFKLEFKHTPDPGDTQYKGCNFLEVWATRRRDGLSADFFEAIVSNSDGARNKAVAMSDSERRFLLPYIEAVAGALALRIHRQLVLVVIDEQPLVFVPGSSPAYSIACPIIENLESVKGGPSLGQALEQLTCHVHEYVVASAALDWLQDSWRAREPEMTFLALFTALETLLNLQPSPPSHKAATAEYRKIRKLIKAHAAKDEAEGLVRVFNALTEKQKPSLRARFEHLASTVKVDGWEDDVKAFESFNRIRNDLVHRGQKAVSLVCSVSEDEVRGLEDLAERYISLGIFGDTRVYHHRFRIHRTIPRSDARSQSENPGPGRCVSSTRRGTRCTRRSAEGITAQAL